MSSDVSDIMSYPVSLDNDESAKMLFCRFNQGVNCYDKSECSKCGWNPPVAEMRVRKLFPDKGVKNIG